MKLRVAKGRVSPTVLGWRSDGVQRFTPSPVVEASVNAKHVRLTMVLVPRSASTAPALIRVTRVRTSAYVRQFDVVDGDRNLPGANHEALGVGRQAMTAFLPDQTRRPSTIVRIAAIRLPVMPRVRSPIVSL